jgi:flagellar basal-body rod protein FlgG
MISGVNSALSGLEVCGGMVGVAAGNLANLNTTGYKSVRLAIGTNGSAQRGGSEVGRGAQILSASRDYSSGPLLGSGNNLDLAIQGDGFFKVRQGGRDVYTRDGSFHLDKDRFLVDAQGNRLQPEAQLPENAASIRVEPNGRLTALDAGGNVVAAANLTLTRFANPNGLESVGHNDYVPTGASGAPLEFPPGTGGAGALAQAALEGSNVDPPREMMNLIMGRHGFTANLKTLGTARGLLGSILDIRA